MQESQTTPGLWVSRTDARSHPIQWRYLALALVAALVASGLLGITPAHSDETSGVWLSADDIASLPTSGAAWDEVRATADGSLTTSTNLAVRDSHNTDTLATALVAARLDDDGYRAKAAEALTTVMDAEPDLDDVLAASRRLVSYVVAADVMGLADYDSALDARFRDWAHDMVRLEYDSGAGGGSIIDIHERRPNNWGTMAGASRAAVASYLGDTDELARTATVFRGWTGDRSAYAGFEYGSDLSWQADPDRPVGINPVGATIEGHPVDGVLPEEQRRGGSFSWPPSQENYFWGGLQGATVQAEILHRQGYDAWNWEEQALRRAMDWVHDEADFPAEGDDTWIPWLVNHVYGTDYPTEDGEVGKNMGFTDWTHANPRANGN
jgi:hypothetical protein